LEPRIKKAGALDAMVPALYKAKLWDTYMEFYKDIESEAEDHFDKLFGREFVRAYMEQTKQLKKTKKT
jgi:predicted component of type VI protein secretion system